MSDHRSLPPLRVAPGPSWRLLVVIIVTHTAALAVLLPLPAMSVGVRLALGALILMSLAYVVWAQVLRRAPWSVVAVAWSGQGWQATFADGRTRDVRLAPSSFVGVGLVILQLRVTWLWQPCLLLSADAVPPDQLRRLRMLLRLGLAGTRADAVAAP
jgi:toxin CptA